MRRISYLLLAAFMAVSLAGCDKSKNPTQYPTKDARGRWIDPSDINSEPAVRGGLNLFRAGQKKDANPENVIQVNRYLWTAAVDVLSTMPLSVVDAYGGVIATEWNIDSENTDERLKVLATIRGIALQARALSVVVHRQILDENDNWMPAEVAKETTLKIENLILERARELRIDEAS